MNLRLLSVVSCAGWFGAMLFAQEAKNITKEETPRTASTGRMQMVTVAEGVKLEVIDWGGTGRPVILLAGLRSTAHAFDRFAPKLTPAYHVYGITRRGFGASTVTDSGYSADQLGDDVLAVMTALKLERPVLVGHSVAGEELSSVATRHPEKVAGLVYLDAAYGHAFYDPALGNRMVDRAEVLRKLEQMQPGLGPRELQALIGDLLQDLPRLEKDLRTMQKTLPTESALTARPPSSAPVVPVPVKAILAGMRKYTAVHVPVLAIFAVPHNFSEDFKNDPEGEARTEAADAIATEAQARAFEVGVPMARVVRLAHASHAVFRSNEADVLREMHAFIDRLPKAVGGKL